MSELHQFFCACCLWLWPDPPLAVLQYVIYFLFYDDVVFSYNGAGALCWRDSNRAASMQCYA